MSEHIPSALVKLVRRRARNICEYCRLPQASQEAAFHIDHVEARSAHGATVPGNLALACVTCSLRKAARSQVRDPATNQMAPLFHPRLDRWSDHFRWSRGCRLAGRTATGRAPVKALGMNRPAIIVIRKALTKLGLFSTSI
jgi:hypothetical protein